MKKQLEYLTHIFRKITARLKNVPEVILRAKREVLSHWPRTIIFRVSRQLVSPRKQTLYVATGLLYLFFLIFPVPQSLFTKTKLQIYGNKNAQLLHVVLADYFLSGFDYQSAKKELLLAINDKPNPEIEIKLKMVSSAETKPEVLKQELVSWQKITKEKPGYRDGFFQEALILYQLKRLNEAKIVLEKVFLLDPNFEAALKLDQLVKPVPNKVEGLD